MSKLVSAFFAFAFLTVPALGNVPPPIRVEPEEMAREVVIAFLENFNAGSADGIASTYADRDGFTWVEQGHVAYATKAEAVAGVTKSLAAMKGARMEMAGERFIRVDPETVFAIVPVTIYMPDGKGGEKEAGKSLTTMTIVQGTDGWRILTGHTAADPAT